MRASWIMAAAGLAAILLAGGGTARADFTLHGDEQLTVSHGDHSRGTLYDESSVRIGPDGRVPYLYAYDTSGVDVSGGSVDFLNTYQTSTVAISSGRVGEQSGYLRAYHNSNVSISGGWVACLLANDASSVDLSGGRVEALVTQHSSTVDISGGSLGNLYTVNLSTVDISGGSVSVLNVGGSGTVDISGGSIEHLEGLGSGTTTFHGYDFTTSGRLVMVGDHLVGTGLLTGKWFGGASWTVNIRTNTPTATIQVIPEPATLALLALGGLAVIRRRRR